MLLHLTHSFNIYLKNARSDVQSPILNTENSEQEAEALPSQKVCSGWGRKIVNKKNTYDRVRGSG